MNSTVTPASYKIGPQHWQHGSDGWYVQMWGWWPGNVGTPAWQWVKVENERVPPELIRRWQEDNR